MGNRVRLLITIDSLPLGGAETVLLQHLENLDRQRFDVHLLTLTDAGELTSDAKKSADHYYCLHRRFALDLWGILKLRNYIDAHKIDVIHTNQWIDSLYVWLASRGIGVRKVVTVHGCRYTWQHLVRLWLLRYFDRIICVSKFVKIDLYKSGLPWEKLAVVYNCYDPKMFGKSSVSYDHSGENPFRMIMVANFGFCRDHETLIQATRILVNKGHNIELNLVGKGNMHLFEACQSHVTREGLNSVVKFWGLKRINGDFLSRFDLFVTSSKCETFGMALLEAMACALPTLVSDIPALMELIQYGLCGLYFETGNAHDCAEKIARLIEDSNLRQSIGEKACRRAQDFLAENVTRDLERIYFAVNRTGIAVTRM